MRYIDSHNFRLRPDEHVVGHAISRPTRPVVLFKYMMSDR
jgi:hypothetical protein